MLILFVSAMFLSFYISVYSSVLSVITAIAKQSQFHPGGSGHPVASFQPSRLQIQLAGRKSFQLCEIASLPRLNIPPA